ncbi:hypothetical protein NL676_017748 [Syzygium grande]|nr:hypothetical protein NL676_017748 [Syzygium grande]
MAERPPDGIRAVVLLVSMSSSTIYRWKLNGIRPSHFSKQWCGADVGLEIAELIAVTGLDCGVTVKRQGHRRKLEGVSLEKPARNCQKACSNSVKSPKRCCDVGFADSCRLLAGLYEACGSCWVHRQTGNSSQRSRTPVVLDAERITEIAGFVVKTVNAVTKFKCGRFTLGIGISHSLVDGVSGMNFVNSWAQIARGKPVTAIPFHDRTLLKSWVPPQIKHPYDDFIQITDTSDTESLYQRDPLGKAKSCTSFAAVTALVWRGTGDEASPADEDPHNGRLQVQVRDGAAARALLRQRRGHGREPLLRGGAAQEGPSRSAVEQIQKAVELLDEDYVRPRMDFVDTYKPRLSSGGHAGDQLLLDPAGLRDVELRAGRPVAVRVRGPGEGSCARAHFLEGEGKEGIAVVLALPLSALNSFEELVQV